jgi:integrase
VTIKKEIHGLRGVELGRTGARLSKDSPEATVPDAPRSNGKSRGRPADDQIEEFLDSLDLTPNEHARKVEDLRQAARHAWVYPMAAFAAQTGSRRSELLRVRAANIDFVGQTVSIRETKRVKGSKTTQRVPMSSCLSAVLKAWLAIHPGGAVLVCHSGFIDWSGN